MAATVFVFEYGDDEVEVDHRGGGEFAGYINDREAVVVHYLGDHNDHDAIQERLMDALDASAITD